MNSSPWSASRTALQKMPCAESSSAIMSTVPSAVMMPRPTPICVTCKKPPATLAFNWPTLAHVWNRPRRSWNRAAAAKLAKIKIGGWSAAPTEMHIGNLMPGKLKKKKKKLENFPHCHSARSLCEMKQKTCGQHVVEAPYSHCALTRHCQRGLKCPKAKKKMICGSDGQFYASECEMHRENCG